MKKIVISLLLLAVCDIPLRASDTSAAAPEKQLNQALLKRANETLKNPEVKKEEKDKVGKALANYNANLTPKTKKALKNATDMAQPGAREAKKKYDKARSAKQEVREYQQKYNKAWRERKKEGVAKGLSEPQQQALLKRANETLTNPEVKEAEKDKVGKALETYNKEQTDKTVTALHNAINIAQPGVREAKKKYDKTRSAQPKVRKAHCEAQRKYERAWRERRKEGVAKDLSEPQQQALRDIQKNRSSSAAAPKTVEAPLAQWLENTSPEELESLLQDAQQQQTIARQAHNNQNDLFAGFDFNAALHNLEEAPDLGAFDEVDDDSAVQSSSDGSFFGEEDLREHYNHLLVLQPKATARVQALGRSSDARAQQIAQRRRSSSDDESEYEEPELSDNK